MVLLLVLALLVSALVFVVLAVALPVLGAPKDNPVYFAPVVDYRDSLPVMSW